MDRVVKNLVATWDCLANKVFCEICVDEVKAGNKPTVHLNAKGYENLAEKFLAKTGRLYDKKKFKNHWDALKSKFSICKDLEHATTGLEWNVVKGTIETDVDWWAQQIKGNSKYSQFKKAPLENIERLEVMFRDIIVTS